MFFHSWIKSPKDLVFQSLNTSDIFLALKLLCQRVTHGNHCFAAWILVSTLQATGNTPWPHIGNHPPSEIMDKKESSNSRPDLRPFCIYALVVCNVFWCDLVLVAIDSPYLLSYSQPNVGRVGYARCSLGWHQHRASRTSVWKMKDKRKLDTKQLKFEEKKYQVATKSVLQLVQINKLPLCWKQKRNRISRRTSIFGSETNVSNVRPTPLREAWRSKFGGRCESSRKFGCHSHANK